MAEKKATAQFLAGVNTGHGPQPGVYPNTTMVRYVAALKRGDVDALVVRLEKEIDQLSARPLYLHVRFQRRFGPSAGVPQTRLRTHEKTRTT
jgi:hypothetical protein